MKSLLQDNYIEMYSTHNEGKSFVAERFVRTLKNKICKYANSFSANVYINKLQFINTSITYRMIKTKPIDVNLSTYTDFVVENNDKYLKIQGW